MRRGGHDDSSKKEDPDAMMSGPSATPVSVDHSGDNRPGSVRRGVRRFSDARDPAPPNAETVTESRKYCEVPSSPSFPQGRNV
jgi:hypothetical protein